jgi:hypothetical protein
MIKFILFICIIGLNTLSAFAQNTIPESDPASSLSSGISYQFGPGSNNSNYGWAYPYGTKFSVYGGDYRNFELLITGRPFGQLRLREWDPWNSIWTRWRKILMEDQDGNIGIGTNSPTAKLMVNGTTKTKEVLVTDQASEWPDYVFKENWHGRDEADLGKLEGYIKTHQHLPGIPTQKEIKENGQNLGVIQSKLLKKIEELTLFTIEQQKIIKRLGKNNRVQKLSIEELSKRVEKLESPKGQSN